MQNRKSTLTINIECLLEDWKADNMEKNRQILNKKRATEHKLSLCLQIIQK
jgi:hypothetical protein